MPDAPEQHQNHPQAQNNDHQPPRKRRRSRNGTRRSGFRGGRGTGQGEEARRLDGIPSDVILEIATYLTPLDLQHLSWTCKSLHIILSSKASQWSWRASVRMVDGLPECPKDISHPKYTALIFGRNCFLCGSGRANWVDFAIRLRLCKTCQTVTIVQGTAAFGNTDWRGKVQVLRYIPCMTGNSLAEAELVANPAKHDLKCRYYVNDVRDILARMNELPSGPDGEAILQLLEGDIIARHEQAIAILGFYLDMVAERKQRISDVKTTWSESIVERLATAGYSEADFPQNNEAWTKLLNQSRELTDRIWNNILPKLEELITVERDRRAKVAYRARIDERLGQIVQHFETFFSDPIFVTDLPLFPTPRDVRDLPSVRDLAQKDDAQDDISKDDFLAITDQVVIDIEAYKLAAKQAAIEKLPTYDSDVEVFEDNGDNDDGDDDDGDNDDDGDSDGGGVGELPFSEDDSEHDNEPDVDASSDAETASAGNPDPDATDQDQDPDFDQDQDPDVMLNKFFAYFRCNEPDRQYGPASCMMWDEYLPFAEIHAHFREAHPQCSWFEREDGYSLSTIHRPHAIIHIGRFILDAVGIPRDTSQSVLDEYVRRGRLYCACGDPMMPPPEELNWIKLFAHVRYPYMRYKRRRRFSQLPAHIPALCQQVMFKPSHPLTGPDCCIKFLPEGVDTSPAWERIDIDYELREKVASRIAMRPTEDTRLACRVCKARRKAKLEFVRLYTENMPDSPEEVVYHLRAWHEKEYEDSDIVFISR